MLSRPCVPEPGHFLTAALALRQARRALRRSPRGLTATSAAGAGPAQRPRHPGRHPQRPLPGRGLAGLALRWPLPGRGLAGLALRWPRPEASATALRRAPRSAVGPRAPGSPPHVRPGPCGSLFSSHTDTNITPAVGELSPPECAWGRVGIPCRQILLPAVHELLALLFSCSIVFVGIAEGPIITPLLLFQSSDTIFLFLLQ